MDENRYQPPEAPLPDLSLERQITIGDTQFLITATGGIDTRINLAVVGCDRDGRVLSEISGGISRANLPMLAEALSSTLAGLVALHGQHHRATVRRRRPANHGVRWRRADDEHLIARHRDGASRRELADEFGRSPAGIRARLEHLGELDRPDPAPTPE
ncbi:hypothetical protein [Actinoplanes sp. NPDC049265]|uniref:hypothetical protein n=1 Tax=Actinoplanes sp. NPDC049265 TaxID=3363902 RepID=UPI003718D8B2